MGTTDWSEASSSSTCKYRLLRSTLTGCAKSEVWGVQDPVPDIQQAQPHPGEPQWQDDSCPGPDERQIDWASENVIWCDLQTALRLSYVATVAGLYDVKITGPMSEPPSISRGLVKEGQTGFAASYWSCYHPWRTSAARRLISLASEPGAESARAEAYNHRAGS